MTHTLVKITANVMTGGQETIALSTRDGATTNVTVVGDHVPATVTPVLTTPTSTTTDTVSVTKTGKENAAASTSDHVTATVNKNSDALLQETKAVPNVPPTLAATMTDTANVKTTGQVTAVTNTPVNATIIVMAVTDQATLTVKSVLLTLACKMVPVNVIHGGPERAVNIGRVHVTQSVTAVSDQTKPTVGTVLTTLNVTARRATMKDMNSQLTEPVAAMKTGATLMTVASTTEIATRTVKVLGQVTSKDQLTVGDQMPLRPFLSKTVK